MPELPEVEANRRVLADVVGGRRLDAVHVADPTSVRASLSTRPSAGGAAFPSVVGVDADVPVRAGKRIGWRLGDHGVLIHLGMTGRIVVTADAAVPRHGRVGFSSGGRTAWLVDARRFGCVVPVPAAALDATLRDGLGPDGLDALPPADVLAARFDTASPIKLALLDQHRLAGLGNIHAVEALWRAGVHPDAAARTLDATAWARLRTGIADQLAHGLRLLEQDAIAYLSDGGGVENPFEVYGRAGQPCRRCGDAISRAVTGGRSTFWCGTCQLRA